MLIDAKPAQNPDTFAAAREKLRVGPVPDWVFPNQPDYGFAPKPAKLPSPTTLLLWSVQTHSEHQTAHVHMAIRLETMQAVQEESQWRLEFEPQKEMVTVHWIKIRRGDVVMDHTQLHKIHLLQREAGLEGCLIDGCFTALLLLEDVRPGDVLEWCYTLETQSRLLPEHRFYFYQLPMAVPVGKFFLAARFAERRLMKWKSSSADLKPEEIRENQEVVWRWAREKFSSPEPEVNIPAWHSPRPWIQLSDCPDWGVVARAVNQVWQTGATDASLTSLVEEICAGETELLPRIQRALRLVQDEFRYLSVNLEHGGQIPTPPDTVARRRFGDCKDLSFLLAHIFRRLGLAASPVLVNAGQRRFIANMLPSPNLFDHAIVQFEVNGQVRWVDATIKKQGGGPLQRVLPHYGLGLVIHEDSTQLVAPPPASVAPGTLRIKETVLLDTTGANSTVAIVSTAEGAEAEQLRHEFEFVPLEELTRRRLQHCADRYRWAQRVGELKFRDDRETNEFHIAEVFEVNGFLTPSPEPGFCHFPLPPNLVNSSLRLPETPTRRDPWALPQPAVLVHTTEVEVRGDQPSSAPRCRVETPLLQFTRQNRCLPGYWSATFTLAILDDVLLPAQLKEHTRKVQEIWRESTWNLIAPLDFPAPIRNRAFGTLPTAPRSQVGRATTSPASTTTPPRTPQAAPTPSLQQVDATTTASSAESDKWRMIDAGALKEAPPRRSRRPHRPRQDTSSAKLIWMVLIGFVVFMIFLIALFASAA